MRPACFRLRDNVSSSSESSDSETRGADDDIVLDYEPRTNFVQEELRVFNKEVFNTRQQRSRDYSSTVGEWSRGLCGSIELLKDTSPAVAAPLRNTKRFTDILQFPSVIPESKCGFFEVVADSTVNHSI